MNLFQLSAACAVATLATTTFAAATPASASERAIREGGTTPVFAREREPGDDRGRGGRRNDDKAPHKLGDDLPATGVARERNEGPKGEGKGHPLTEDVPALLARERNEGPKGEGKGHPVADEVRTQPA